MEGRAQEMVMNVDPTSSAPRIPNPAAREWMRWVADHNPCFLLSAVSMFLGCYLLNSAMDVRAAEVGKSLLLLATINGYEAALIALGLSLLRKADGRGRDGVLLLIVEMLFLADGPFLIGQVVQAGGAWGWVIAMGLAGLALVKGGWLMAGARIRVGLRTFGFLSVQVALIYGLPAAFARLQVDGELAAGPMYAAWWAVGLLPAAYEMLARFLPREEDLGPRRELVRRGLVVVPWVLLVAHVAFFHYVYRAEFFAGELAPLVLGLAVAMRRVKPRAMWPEKQLRFLRLTMPVVAVLLALAGPGPTMHWFGGSVQISAELLTTAGAVVAYGYFISLPAAGLALAGVAMMGVGWWMRAEIRAVLGSLYEVAAGVAEFLLKLAPTSTEAWGILAIVSAFALLGAGGLWSLRPQAKEPRQ
jgi:hypothetical protein